MTGRLLRLAWGTVTVLGLYYAGAWSEAGRAGGALLCVVAGLSAGALVWQASNDRSDR